MVPAAASEFRVYSVPVAVATTRDPNFSHAHFALYTRGFGLTDSAGASRAEIYRAAGYRTYARQANLALKSLMRSGMADRTPGRRADTNHRLWRYKRVVAEGAVTKRVVDDLRLEAGSVTHRVFICAQLLPGLLTSSNGGTAYYVGISKPSAYRAWRELETLGLVRREGGHRVLTVGPSAVAARPRTTCSVPDSGAWPRKVKAPQLVLPDGRPWVNQPALPTPRARTADAYVREGDNLHDYQRFGGHRKLESIIERLQHELDNRTAARERRRERRNVDILKQAMAASKSRQPDMGKNVGAKAKEAYRTWRGAHVPIGAAADPVEVIYGMYLLGTVHIANEPQRAEPMDLETLRHRFEEIATGTADMDRFRVAGRQEPAEYLLRAVAALFTSASSGWSWNPRLLWGTAEYFDRSCIEALVRMTKGRVYTKPGKASVSSFADYTAVLAALDKECAVEGRRIHPRDAEHLPYEQVLAAYEAGLIDGENAPHPVSPALYRGIYATYCKARGL